MASKYEQIAEKIRREIMDGVFDETMPLPTQAQLAKRFHTSRMTIQKALDQLRLEGIVESRQGSGTYLRKNGSMLSELDSKADEYTGLSKQLTGKGPVTSRVLRFDLRFPTEREQKQLNIQGEDPVYDILRVRIFREEPLVMEETVMPVHIIPRVSVAVLHASIYQHIEETLQLEIGAASRRISAEKATEMDQRYLNCQKEDPVLQVLQTVYLSDGTPFEYSCSRHRYDNGDILVVNQNRKKRG